MINAFFFIYRFIPAYFCHSCSPLITSDPPNNPHPTSIDTLNINKKAFIFITFK